MVFQLSGKAESEWGRRAEAVQGEEQSSLERDTGCGQVGGGGVPGKGGSNRRYGELLRLFFQLLTFLRQKDGSNTMAAPSADRDQARMSQGHRGAVAHPRSQETPHS